MRAVIRLTIASRRGALALAVLLALLASVGSLRAQRTWVVDDTMAPGADYPDLQSACAAATSAWKTPSSAGRCPLRASAASALAAATSARA